MIDNRVRDLLAGAPESGKMAKVIEIMESRVADIEVGLNKLNLNYKGFWAWVWDGITGHGWNVKYS